MDQPSGPAANVADINKQGEAEMKEAPSSPSFSDILSEVDLGSLEKIVGELLPNIEQDVKAENSMSAER